MAEKHWGKAIAYAAVIAVAGITYYLAQTAIEANRAALPVRQYLDCIQRVSNFDWSKFPGEKPSSSEVCKDLTTREKAHD
ncbi:MAG: hypothetical protein GTO24_07820 [candidate division Zixibacteria bacterium]|nr:hypothetical protein [candidate division Zixibacteria bacterium]